VREHADAGLQLIERAQWLGAGELEVLLRDWREHQSSGVDRFEPCQHRVSHVGRRDAIGLEVILHDERQRQHVQRRHAHRVERPRRRQDNVEVTIQPLLLALDVLKRDLDVDCTAGRLLDLVDEAL
jgi:hypothetical protein